MTELEAFLESMPNLVKLTIVGIGLEPPTIDPQLAVPSYFMALEHFVKIGIAVSSISGVKRTYHLTPFGQESFNRVQHHQPSDGSLPANDDDFDGPQAA